MSKKFVCTVCGYIHEGDSAPEKCPQCNVPATKFNEMAAEQSYVTEHVIGVAQGCPEEIMEGLNVVCNTNKNPLLTDAFSG